MTSLSRVVRIFISSTFLDFAGERDELVKKVFPELRRRCKARFVELLEVDLRWGITEEQSRRGDTLRICLQEIDRCRPSTPVFFLGLLGERYGWIPDADYYPKDVLEDPALQWVHEHVGGKSVTELEILHGVLNNVAMASRSYFYFRNHGYQHRHWPEIQATHPHLRPEDFGNGSEADAVKQSELKERIRRSGLQHEPREYEVPAEMAQRALEDLWAEIDRAFPASETPDELTRQRMEHEAFAQSRLKGYVPRVGLFEQLDQVLTEEAPGCKVVTGQSGGGKSALLAAWMEQAKLPERTFVHYIGGTPESSTVRSIVLRLMETIRRWGAVREPIPNDFGEAVQVLPEWLAKAADGQKDGLLVVLDALNQMEEERDRELWWLPQTLPEGVRLVVSTLPGPSEKALRARGWLTATTAIDVPPLTDSERREIIASYLGRFTKKLEQRFVERLAVATQTGNALFLKVALDELRLRGRHEELGGMVERMLEAKGPIELFIQVLKQLEEFDHDRPNLVREALGYLHEARRGLTESELLQLLSSHPEPSSHPLPMAVWSPLYLALEESLVSRFGRLGFFHDYLRQAVEREYLDEEWERKRVHGRLGEVALAWNTERFSPLLRSYGLAYGAHHLRQEGGHEKLWTLLEDEGYRKAQGAEFQRVDETVEGLKHGIEVYAERDGQTDEDDVRLCWLMLRCGEVVQEARTSMRPIFEEFRTRPIDDQNRLEDALSRLQILDEVRFYQACQLLLYIECERSEGEGIPVSIARAAKIVEAVEVKVPKGTKVPVAVWLDKTLVLKMPWELWNKLIERPRESDERTVKASRSLISSKRWGEVLEMAERVKDKRQKAETIASIAGASTQSGQMLRALEVAESIDKQDEQCYTLYWIVWCLAQSEKVDWALEVAASIEDIETQVRAISDVAASLAIAGHASRAEKLFSRALKLARSAKGAYEKDEALLSVVEALTSARMFERSTQAASRIRDPRLQFGALISIATGLTAAGHKRKSIDVLNQALRLASSGLGIESLGEHRDVFADVFEKLLVAGDSTLALVAAKEGLLQPIAKARGFADAGIFDQAAQFVDEALLETAKITSRHARSKSLRAIGEVLAVMGDLDQSMNVMDEIQQEEIKTDGLHAISEILATSGNSVGAMDFYCCSLESAGHRDTSGQNSANLLVVAVSLAQAGDLERAFQSVHLFKTSWQQTWIVLAIVEHLAQMGEHGRTAAMFTRILEIIGKAACLDDQLKVADSIAAACVKLGYFKGRDELLDAALKINPAARISVTNTVTQTHTEALGTGGMSEMELVQSIEASIKRAGDQGWAFKAIISDLVARIPPDQRWIKSIAPLERPERFYDFLNNMEIKRSARWRGLSWLRLFGTLCPKRLDIDWKLASDLVAAHVCLGNILIAQKIARRCPQLGLSEILN